MGKMKITIKGRILIPFFLISILFFVLTQSLVYIYLTGVLSDRVDDNLKKNTTMLHGMMEISFRENIQNYLRGVTEQNIQVLQALQQEVEAGSLSLSTAQERAGFLIHSQGIGEDGYSYVTNSSGTILIHPDQNLINSDSIFTEEFLQRDSFTDEFVEYEFNNRLKVLYRIYFEEWDWVVATTAYRDDFMHLLDVGNLDTLFSESPNQMNNVLLDNQGRQLCPQEMDLNLNVSKDAIDLILEDPRDSGIVEISQELSEASYRIYFSKIEDFNWILVSTISLSEVYKPVHSTSFLLAGLSGLIFFIILLLVTVIVRRISRPLKRLTSRLIEEGHSELKDISLIGDELEVLEGVFNKFMRRLKLEEQRLLQANEENRILARFPHELQFPLLRMNTLGQVSFMNEAAKQMQTLFMDPLSNKVHPDILKLYQDCLDRDKGFDLHLKDSCFHVVPTKLQYSNEVYLHFHDQTMIRQYQTLQNIWQSVFESSQEGIAVSDSEGVLEQINESFTRITGYSQEEILGKKASIFYSDRQKKGFLDELLASLKQMGHWQGEVWSKRKDGEVYLEWLSISSFQDIQSGCTKYMSIFHDLSDLMRKEEELNHAIQHDSLTDLPNRYTFYEELNRNIEQCEKEEILGVMLIDIDNFTMIYNYLGGKSGDEYLRQLTHYFQDVIRSQDTLARLGTAEFAILLKDIHDPISCYHMIGRLQAKLDRTMVLEGQSIIPLVNLGISLYPEDGDTADLLIRRARLAMHQARSTRRGSYQFYDPSMELNQQFLFDVDSALKAAIRNREFYVDYQPKAQYSNGMITGFEALIRWNRSDKGNISPSEFIPVLEENGMIIEVGEWLIGEVCRFINTLRGQTKRPFRIAINVSTRQFASPLFRERLNMIRRDHRVSAEYIELEITENIAALELDGVIESLKDLREEGYTIALDDFGTGYSSLAYLSELPFDSIKIDRSFIHRLGDKDNTNALAIIRSIATLAKSMGKETVAEGVETLEQSEICRQEGLDIIQGFLFSRPLHQEDARAIFEQKKLFQFLP